MDWLSMPASFEHPNLGRSGVGVTPLEPLDESLAGGGFVAVSPQEAFEYEAVALVHHLCPEPRPVLR
jgi:hypothetical protein